MNNTLDLFWGIMLFIALTGLFIFVADLAWGLLLKLLATISDRIDRRNYRNRILNAQSTRFAEHH